MGFAFANLYFNGLTQRNPENRPNLAFVSVSLFGLRQNDRRALLSTLRSVSNNLIFESGGFPVGTGGASFQVNDLGTNNRVIGHPACYLTDPGIGQLIQEARQQIVDTMMQISEEAVAAEVVKKR